MIVPMVMTPPRQLVHQQFCPTASTCRFQVDASFAGPQCKKLDELLDFHNDMLLHSRARELFSKWTAMLTTRERNTLGPGILWSVEEIDPYTRIEEFTGDPETHIHPGEEHPECPACVEGKMHYHRKADGSLVKSPSV